MPYQAPFIHVKLIISINQADNASILTGIWPKNSEPLSIYSKDPPVRAWMAGMEVKTALIMTSMQLTLDFIREGETRISSNPTNVNAINRISNL